MKFVLLHETRNDDGIRSFFLDVWELYVKVSRHGCWWVRADASQLDPRQCSTRFTRHTRLFGVACLTHGCGRARRSTCERPGTPMSDDQAAGQWQVNMGQAGGAHVSSLLCSIHASGF